MPQHHRPKTGQRTVHPGVSWCWHLTIAGATDEAVAACRRPAGRCRGHRQSRPCSATRCSAYGWAHRDVDPAAAYDALRRGLTIAQDSGNRQIGVDICGDPGAARRDTRRPAGRLRLPDPGHPPLLRLRQLLHLRIPLAILAALFDRLGRYEPAATISGFAANASLARTSFPRSTPTHQHLREVLGDEVYESLARTGETHDQRRDGDLRLRQIERARAELTSRLVRRGFCASPLRPAGSSARRTRP